MLTSFGARRVEPLIRERSVSDIRAVYRRLGHNMRDYFSEHSHVAADPSSLFERMPPIDMRSPQRIFVPDYVALLLSEKLVVDMHTFQRLQTVSSGPYATMAQTVLMLERAGFVELADYDGIIDLHGDLLDRMMDEDLVSPEVWLESMSDSLETWRSFTSNWIRAKEPSAGNSGDIMVDFTMMFAHQAAMEHQALQLELSGRYAPARMTDFRLRLLRHHLSYVNATLVISADLGVGFHDWSDFMPYYRRKFLGIGQGDAGNQKAVESGHRLFTVSFPELNVADPDRLLQVVNHPLIDELRTLIQSSVDGDVEFDQEFANGVLRDVLKAEQRSSRVQRTISWLTLPLGVIPGSGIFGPKIVEELTGLIADNFIKKKHRWYYMLSDIAQD